MDIKSRETKTANSILNLIKKIGLNKIEKKVTFGKN